MKGMEYRLEPVEGIPQAGRLVIRGPNIMLGYIKPEAPGVIHPPKDGWYDTGDIVSVDEEGYIKIRGRLKRFAKIGGEAVSLAVMESCASAVWPDYSHAALAVPDRVKGEQIVLITDCPNADRMDQVGWAQNLGVSELAIPRRVVHVESIPVLGTGKTDYAKVQKMLMDNDLRVSNT
jgi:acyl-[acyl-carrier-protein]-phospholipid O-acyltransferase/long-chain-fatty-acid--[acyl-carrier-protein] ligase